MTAPSTTDGHRLHRSTTQRERQPRRRPPLNREVFFITDFLFIYLLALKNDDDDSPLTGSRVYIYFNIIV
jgi:hypothetical protein